MKPLFTFLLTCAISLSLTGQQHIRDVHELKKQYQVTEYRDGFGALQKKLDRKPDHAPRHSSERLRQIQATQYKADQANEQQMDSIIWEAYDTVAKKWIITDRELFTYDASGNMINYMWFELDSVSMKLVPEERETVTYNPQGQPTEIIQFGWDEGSGQWAMDLKFELTYDGNGNLVKEQVYEWDGAQWLVFATFDMTYDGAGNMVEELWSFWDEDSAKLVPLFKDVYIYEVNRVDTMYEYMWEGGAWELTYRTIWTYGGELLQQEFTQALDPFSEQWVDYSKWVYTYNMAARLGSEEYWDFDWNQLQMVRQWLYLYTWDNDGNLAEQVDQAWEEGSSWVNVWKSVWSYNKNFSIMDLYVPYWFMMDPGELQFIHMPVSELGYFFVDGEWVEDYRQTAYYSEFSGGGPSGIKDVNKVPVSVFPIPASDFINFSWDEKYTRLNLELYDLTGKRIISRSIKNNEKLPVDQFSSGVYLYRLRDKNGLIQNGKISLK